MALETQPSAAVTVTISGQASSDLVVDPSSLTFSTSNWSAAQTVTVTARDDADALTDPVVTLTHRASGGDYGAVTGDLRVTITDNDSPGLAISQSAFTVVEGNAAGQSYTVALETQPSAAVTVTISGQASSDLVVDPSSLTFSTSNWSAAQTVTVTARDDADALTDPVVTLTHRASGGDYGAVTGDLRVTITDNDSPNLAISQSAFTVVEGDGTGQSYTVALETEPSAAVTVTISGQASSDLVVDPSSLTFSTSNWSAAQTVTVTARDDADALTDPVVTLTHRASGGDYGAVTGDLRVTITDNDSPNLAISQSAFTVVEGDGTGQSYTVALTTQPSAAVTVTISGQASSDLVVDPSSLTFSTSNWSAAQTVTVTARDDADALTDPVVTLTHRASGGDYGAVTGDLRVTIDEVDSPGLAISQSAFTVVEGDGTGQSYTVALETQPSAAVTVTISGQASSDLVVDPSSLTFSTSNWSAAQTVTVTARDDADALTDPVVTLTHRASGGDYGAVTGDLRVTITDNDSPGLAISQSAFTVVEGNGTGQSYTVALETQPSAAVTVTISGQASSDLVVDPSSLTFSTSNWSAAQTVTVTARDDADALTDPVVTLTHRASGGDYGAVTGDLRVTITDNDSPNLAISQSAFTVVEGDGTGQSYTVALETEPSAAVTVTISGQASSDLVVDPSSLTFSTSNWSAAQTVTVTARDDADALTDPVVTLTHRASGGDYGAVTGDLRVTITDNDSPNLAISQSAFTVVEGDGTGQSYTVALTTQPSAAVTVTISGQASSDLVVDPSSLTFSTSNWSAAQTVTVTARDDADALTDPVVTLTHRASGGDYGAVTGDLRVTITDNDSPNLAISQSAFTVVEGDGTGQSYTVALTTQPSAAVTVTISGQASSDLVVDPSSLTFSTSNWSAAQTVTVTARDDADALTDPVVTLTHRASGGDYGAVTGDLRVTITDNDSPNLAISQSAFTVVEGDGTGQSYTVALTTQPSAAVTVTISGQASSDLVVDPSSLTFSTSNWSAAQTVTVTARDDADALTDPVVTLTHRASGGDYGAVTGDLRVTITDNDSPNLAISQSAFTVVEGDGTGQSYTVALETQPSAAVTVTISGQASSDLVVDPSSLTFSTSNWSAAQTVTVTARDDADALTDPVVTLTHRASGGDYGAVTGDLRVTITDNDSPNLAISQSAFTVVEGDGTGQSYTVALTTQPSAAVTVTISGQASSDLVVDPSSLTFSTSNWSAAQTVTVTARDDADALTDPVVTLTHRASGGDYGAVTGDLRVTITDNDSPNLAISQSAFTVVEGDGTGQSYTVALETEPSAAVTVTISGQASSDLVVDPSSLTFSTSNWSAAQTVTVTARDDADALTDPVVTLTHRASGGDYGAVTGDLRVTITDNDSPGLAISQSAFTVVEGNGTGQSYTVALETEPSAAVTVTISGQASSDLVVDPSSLTFSTSNWSAAQTVTVTARDDADALTDPVVTLTHRASGGDYGAVTGDLRVTITDNDSPNLAISQSAFTVVEGDGTGQSYTVALETQPSAAVTVTISGQASSDLVVDPSSLTFSTSNWSAAQTVTVTARDDADALTDPVVTLTHRASGGDYGAVTGDLRVTITDNDSPNLAISQSAFTVVEGDGTGQSYTVALDHPALGGGDGNDQRTGKQRPGRGPVQPDL